MLTLAAVVMTAVAQPLTPVQFSDVNYTSGFWAQRLAAVREATLHANFHQCEITGRLDNFAVAAGTKDGAYQGYYFNDSDVYKAIEGAAYVLATLPRGEQRAALDKRLDDVIATIAASQQPDGYINSYFTAKEKSPNSDPDTRWSNTAVKHELYCIGHLIEAGVAHYIATGKRSLLDVAVRAADLVDSVFGPPPKRPDIPGHEELELALIRLSRIGNAVPDRERFLRLAAHFVNSRGVSHSGRTLYGEYCQDHIPLREQTEAVGHAVRATYLYSAATDLATISPEPALSGALDRLWTDLTGRKMYVTGGIGNSGHNEGFTTAYDLPNDTAYAETCATIGLTLWAQRMNLLHADARYFDVLERALYNGVLSGLSLDGSKFFYENPLGSTGDHHRRDWYACACCPPNILRVLASLGERFYAMDDDAIYVNLYGASETRVSSNALRIIQRTEYPWDGKVTIEFDVSLVRRAPRDLMLRIPEWCDEYTITGSNLPSEKLEVVRGYARIPGGATGGTVEINFKMPIRRVYAHPAVAADRGRVALQRGPIVYCLEDADNPAGARSIALPPGAPINAEFRSGLLGGVTVLTGEGLALAPQDWDEDELYRSADAPKVVPFTAIPYFAWDNREPGGMQVWIPESASLAPLGPLPGVTPSASHTWGSDNVAALTDRQIPASSADHQVPRHTWWPRRGSTEWVQLDFDSPRRLHALDVYWFDDGPPGGGGGCRVPASWSIEYRATADGEWNPVPNPRGTTTDRDRFNRATFDAIDAAAVRISAELQPGFSGGVLEIRPVR